MTLTVSHDLTLVALSILIATVASYPALDLAGRIRATSGWPCYAWLATAALAMGGGIWSMHFVAMLAFSMPGMPVDYDLRLTTLSFVMPVIITTFGFSVANRRDAGLLAIALSGLAMGLGIVIMHYTGMAAMLMPADLRHDRIWVALSVLIALGASTVALVVGLQDHGCRPEAHRRRGHGTGDLRDALRGHAGCVFTGYGADAEAHGHASLGQTTLAIAVTATTFLILFLALIAAMVDRRLALRAEREALALRRSEERFRTLYRRTPLPLHSLNAEGIIEHVSDAWLALMGYPREEVMGRRLINFMTEESARRRMQEDMPKLLAAGELKESPIAS